MDTISVGPQGSVDLIPPPFTDLMARLAARVAIDGTPAECNQAMLLIVEYGRMVGPPLYAVTEGRGK